MYVCLSLATDYELTTMIPVQFELEQQLCLFARDEIVTWCHGQKRPWTHDLQFRVNAAALIESLVKKAETMACKAEREQVCFDSS